MSHNLFSFHRREEYRENHLIFQIFLQHRRDLHHYYIFIIYIDYFAVIGNDQQ